MRKFFVSRYVTVISSRSGDWSISNHLVLFVLSIMLMASGAAAQTGVKIDFGVYPEDQAPSLPKAGGKLADPTFGTEIMRVTDEADGANFGTAYAYWPTFNVNNTRIFVQDDDGAGLIYDFDPVNFSLGAKTRFVYPSNEGNTTDEDAIWSALNPDILFVHRGAVIWAYNVRTRTYSVVGDMTANFPAGTYFVQMSVDRNDDVFAFTVKNPDYSVRGYAVWKDSANKIIYSENTPDIDEVQIDKTGQYLAVKTPFQGKGVIQTRLVDLQTQLVTNLTDDAPDYAVGHGDYGKGIVVGHDNWLNRITFRNLETPHAPYTVLSFGGDWAIDYHLSLLTDNEDWGLVSVYNSAAGGTFERELFLVATDGTQRVKRFAHHYSRMNSYYDTPRANISRDGRYVAFTSNWGGRGRRDLFIAKVPTDGNSPAPAPSPSPSPSPSPTATPKPTPSPSPTATPPPAPADGFSQSGNSASWQNILGTTSVYGTVQHSGTAYFGLARSKQVMLKGAYFEWTYNANKSQVWAGLGNNSDEVAKGGAKDLSYAFDGNMIREMGVYKAEFKLVHGDRLRIEIDNNGRVIYKRNGTEVYRSKKSASGYYYLVFKSQEAIGVKITDTIFSGVNYGK